jgi:SAM-dependent methyltransferase
VVVAGPDGTPDLLAPDLLAAASRDGIPVEVVPADEDSERLVARLVDVVGDGRDTVIVGSGEAAATSARRTGADLWAPVGEPERYAITPSAECRDDALEQLHDEEADPWGVETRWYERRKRELVLAMLPRKAFDRALELGCSTGALAEALASRSHSVVAVDRSTTAVAAAGRRFQGVDHVQVVALDVPREWPEGGPYDLVVVSEVGYFMSPLGLENLVGRVADTLTLDGVVVLCHWRHPIVGWVLDGEDVHHGFRDPRLPPVAATYRDRDVEILVLGNQDSWPDPAQ